ERPSATSDSAAPPLSALALPEETILRCQKGDRRAFDELYFAYRRQVAAQLYRLIGASDVEDSVQEVFLEVWRSIGRFRLQSKFSTWLYRLTVHVALRRLRTRKRREPPAAGDPDELPTEDTPERALGRKDAIHHAFRILEQMSPKKRIVFVLHEI